MHSFEQLLADFESRFNTRHFPNEPHTLYDASQYILGIGGKRARPVLCIMGNELFDTIKSSAWEVATAIELFHNFTLIHDDIMDQAPLRRGAATVHTKFGTNTAILAGDVVMIMSYEYLRKVEPQFLPQILGIFNKTALEVSEGQQLDMDFEKRDTVHIDEYINMITLKTSVLLAASLSMGACIGGAGDRNTHHLYEFGKNLGIAFQIQDDYLDAFGDPVKFGKQVGGDILANKKTFLMIEAMQSASSDDKSTLQNLMSVHTPDKIKLVLDIFKRSGVDAWAVALKNKYLDIAYTHLDEIAVMNNRKKPLKDLAAFLVQRDY
jgi:geranylgeranyl diphosphate synthase type II